MEKDGKGDMCESRWVLRRRKSIIFPLLNANFHKCDDLCKQWYMLIISVSEGSGVWEWLSWVLCSGSHKAIISVSARLHSRLEFTVSFRAQSDRWHSLVAYGRGTEALSCPSMGINSSQHDCPLLQGEHLCCFKWGQDPLWNYSWLGQATQDNALWNNLKWTDENLNWIWIAPSLLQYIATWSWEW